MLKLFYIIILYIDMWLICHDYQQHWDFWQWWEIRFHDWLFWYYRKKYKRSWIIAVKMCVAEIPRQMILQLYAWYDAYKKFKIKGGKLC